MKSDSDYRREEAQMWRAAIILAFTAFMSALFVKAVSTPPGVYQRVVTDCILAGGAWEMVFYGRTPDRNMYSCVADGNLLTLIPNPNRE